MPILLILENKDKAMLVGSKASNVCDRSSSSWSSVKDKALGFLNCILVSNLIKAGLLLKKRIPRYSL